jgi:hypothetical protein
MDSRNTLILLTAGLRLDKLYNIALSINNNINKLNNTDLIWLICIDQYNGKGDYDDAIEYCKSNGITVFWIGSGLSNQPNYGGDIFNEPLRQLESKFNFDDTSTWIYILDDDNIVHPNLFLTFNDIINCGSQYRIAWTNYIIEDGRIPDVRRANALGIDKSNRYCNLPDPSCLFIRLDKLHEVGYWKGEMCYDIKFAEDVIRGSLDEILFPEDLNNYWNSIATAYHNGQVTISNFEYDQNSIATGQLTDIVLRTSSYNDKKSKVYPIPVDLADKILDLIKNYYIKSGIKL